MKEILCKTCARNTKVFPCVQCCVESKGPTTDFYYKTLEERDKILLTDMRCTECDKYIHKDVPWVAVRFTFSNGHKIAINNLLNSVTSLSVFKEKPIKIEISAGGKFNTAEKKIIYQFITKEILPTEYDKEKSQIIFYNNSFKLLGLAGFNI